MIPSSDRSAGSGLEHVFRHFGIPEIPPQVIEQLQFITPHHCREGIFVAGGPESLEQVFVGWRLGRLRSPPGLPPPDGGAFPSGVGGQIVHGLAFPTIPEGEGFAGPN